MKRFITSLVGVQPADVRVDQLSGSVRVPGGREASAGLPQPRDISDLHGGCLSEVSGSIPKNSS